MSVYKLRSTDIENTKPATVRVKLGDREIENILGITIILDYIDNKANSIVHEEHKLKTGTNVIIITDKRAENNE